MASTFTTASNAKVMLTFSLLYPTSMSGQDKGASPGPAVIFFCVVCACAGETEAAKTAKTQTTNERNIIFFFFRDATKKGTVFAFQRDRTVRALR